MFGEGVLGEVAIESPPRGIVFVQNTEPPEKGEKGLTRGGKYDKINKLLQENEK